MGEYLLKIKWNIIINCLLFTLETACFSIMLSLPGMLIDSVDKGSRYLLFLGCIYIGVFLFYLLVCYASNRCADFRRVKFEKALKQDYFNAALKQSRHDFTRFDVGEYISMQSNDITEMCQNYLSPMLGIYRSLIMIIVFGICLFVLVDSMISIVIIGFSFLATLVPRITADILATRNAKYMKTLGKYTTKIKSFFESHPTLDHRSKEKLSEQNEKALDNLFNDNMKFRKVNSLSYVLNGGSIEVVSVITFMFVGYLLINGYITVGMATTAFIYSNKFTEPFYELNTNLGAIHSVKHIQEKLVQFLKATFHEKKEIHSFHEMHVYNVQIEFPDKVLHFPNMHFVNGKKYLIVGGNGSGKTSFLNALFGVNAYKGTISIDGNEARDVNLDSIVAYGSQQSYMFEGNYIENVSVFGAYDISQLEVYESYFPKDVIDNIKNNETMVHLSAGEKQVVALLRCFCMDKQCIILDEPFANLNDASIHCLMEHIHQINKTIIMIGHNVDTYQDMFDEVYKF